MTLLSSTMNMSVVKWNEMVAFYCADDKFPLVLIIGILIVSWVALFYLSLIDGRIARKLSKTHHEITLHYISASEEVKVLKGKNGELMKEVELLIEEKNRLIEEKDHYEKLYRDQHSWAMQIINKSINPDMGVDLERGRNCT